MSTKIADRFFSLNHSTALASFFVAVAIMGLMACSSDNDGTPPPSYVVQATLSVDDDGPVAFAIVLDEVENLVSTPILSINGRPMEIDYFAGSDVDESGTGEIIPYYFLDLPDLKGGDTVQFLAVSPSGAKIFAPPPAIIPMAIELLEPQEGQEIIAGDEVLIRWTGGEGAKVFSAAYAALDGSALYSVEEAPGEAGSGTIPAGQTVQGDAVLGVGAIAGDIGVMVSFDNNFMSRESYFLVSREAGVQVFVQPKAVTRTHDVTQSSFYCPPVSAGMGDYAANFSCMGQFAALGIGAIIWENRRQCDLKRSSDNNPCRSTTNILQYCVEYGSRMGHAHWSSGCLWCYTDSSYNHPRINWKCCHDCQYPCQPGPCPK